MPGRRAAPVSFERAVQYATALLVLALVVLPLAPTVYQSFRDLPLYEAGGALGFSAYARLLGSREFLTALGNTLIVAVGATVLAQILGACCALVVARTDMPARRFVGSLMLWPLYLSQLVLALGWIVAYGPSGIVTLWLGQWLGGPPWNLYSLGGLTIVAGCSLAPLTYMYCADAARTVDPALEDAMRMSGAGPLRALFAVTVPLIRPALTASMVLNFVLCLELFSLPLLLGVPSGYEFLTTFIYSHGFEASPPDHALVGALAVVLLLIASLLVMVQGRLIGDRRRFVTISGKAGQRRLAPLGPWRWPLAGLALAYIGLTTVVVIGCLVLRAFTTALSPYVPLLNALTLSNFALLLDDPATLRAIANTVTTALAVGVIGTAIAVAAALVATRSSMPGRRLLEFVALYPRAVPGILIRPGTLEKLGYGPDVLLGLNPALVITRLSGWGQTGPYRHRPGFGTLVEAFSGFAHKNGFPDKPPALPNLGLADSVAGLYGAAATLTALRHVEVGGGHGQVVDVSLLEPIYSILGADAAVHRASGRVPTRHGNSTPLSSPRNLYRSRDGKYLAISGSTQAMTERLLTAISRPELIADPRFRTNADRVAHAEALDREIQSFIGQRTLDENLAYFEVAGVTAGPVHDGVTVTTDPHMIERGTVLEFPDDELAGLPMHAVVPRLSQTPGAIRRPAPALDEHAAEIMRELGFETDLRQ